MRVEPVNQSMHRILGARCLVPITYWCFNVAHADTSASVHTCVRHLNRCCFKKPTTKMNVEGLLQESGQQNLPHYIASIPHTIPSAKACNTEHASKSCRLIQNMLTCVPPFSLSANHSSAVWLLSSELAPTKLQAFHPLWEGGEGQETPDPFQ